MTARSRTMLILLRVVASAAMIAWILSKTDLGQVMAALRRADPRWIALALLLIPMGHACSLFRWRLLLRARGGEASLPYLYRSLMTGIFFNNLLPSTVGGDAVRAWDTARLGFGAADAVAIIAIDRFIGLLALIFFAAGGLLVSGALIDTVPDLTVWVAGTSAAMLLIAALLFLPSARSANVLARLGRRIPFAGKISSALFAFRGRTGPLAAAFFWSVCLQALVVLNAWLLGRAIGVQLPLPYYFIFVPLSIFVMLAPVSINGIGVRENVFAFFFVAFGVAPALGVALAWLDYLLTLVQALVGGVLYASGRRVGDAHFGLIGEAPAGGRTP